MIKEIYDDLKKSKFGKVLIGLLLLVVSLFTLWNSLPDNTKENIISGAPIEIKPEPKEEIGKPKVVLEKLTAKWLGAWFNGDTETFVQLSSEPFYFDKKIILTRHQLRSEYNELSKEKGKSWRQINIDKIKVQTIRELKEQGHDLSKDRIFPSLNLTLDDYAITVLASGEGMILMAREHDGRFEFVGTWD